MNRGDLIIIIEDESSFATFLKTILEEEGFEVVLFDRAERALQVLPDLKPPIVICDLRLPGIDGIQFVERAKKILPATEFLIITAYGSIPSAVEALKKGAVDYLTKPLSSPEDLIEKIKTLLSKRMPQDSQKDFTLPPFEILFAGIEGLYEEILEVAPTTATILLLGETGTGKSAIAKAIHLLSGRKGPFVEINCASLPENLVEAELFGYEKGAFTGALKTKPGKLEIAKGGTLFLDEISEMSLTVQAKFLKVLQERTFERLGGLETLKTDARFITATNRSLSKLVSEGKFREDLYYRVNVITFYIPPLRKRRAHLIKIAQYILHEKAQKLGKKSKPFSKEALKILQNYHFPGNIRELENILERSLLLSKGDYLEIPLEERTPHIPTEPQNITNLRELEKEAILRALEETKGQKKEAAKRLGISLRTLYYKLKEFGLT